MIRIEGLTKRYDGRPAVNDLDLLIGKGELCVLLGPSGCGKSTTLRLVNRLLPADGGTVWIDGRDTAEVPPDILRRNLGYVIQSVGLFPHMTVFDNIAVVPRLKKWDRRRTALRVEELLVMIGLPPAYADRYPRELSGGEAQRVGVARALAGEPSVLLMDEPFGALDLLNRRLLQNEFRNLQRRLGTTVLFVTHDVDEALELADTMAVMNEGRIVQRGDPEDFLYRSSDSFIPRFLGPDYGLKMLGRRRVADRFGKGRENAAAGGAPAGAVPGLPAEATMKDAVAAMVEGRTSRLTVVDESGGVVGTLDAADIFSGGNGKEGHAR